MSEIWNRIRNEPVLVTVLVEATIGLVVAFGVALSTAQSAAILVFTGAILAFVARRAVTPAR